MSDILFESAEHQMNFENMLNRLSVQSRSDLCYRSTLYLLAMITSDGGNYFDFDRCCITPGRASEYFEYLEEYEGVVKLAYMLWGGLYTDNLYDYDISRIFNTPCAVYMIQALKIRFVNFLDNEREHQLQERDTYWEMHQDEKDFLEQEILKLKKEQYHLEQEILSLSATIPFLQSKETAFRIWCSMNTFQQCRERLQKISVLKKEYSSLKPLAFSKRKQLTKTIADEEKKLDSTLSREQVNRSNLELSSAEEEALKMLSVKLSLFNSMEASIDKLKYELIRDR